MRAPTASDGHDLRPRPRNPGLRAGTALVGACALAASCAPDARVLPDEDVVVDDAGRLHSVLDPRTRVVSLVPSVTETLVAIGAADRLIVRTQYDHQPELASLPVVNAVLEPSVEAIHALAPDLVVMWLTGGDGGSVGERLEAVGIDWYGASIQTVADFERNARNFGRLLHLADRSDSVITSVRTELALSRAEWTGRQPAEIFYVVQLDPPMTVGPGTFLDSIFSAGGAANVFHDIKGNWPLVSLEEIVWRDPEYVVVPVTGTEPRDPPRLPRPVAGSPCRNPSLGAPRSGEGRAHRVRRRGPVRPCRSAHGRGGPLPGAPDPRRRIAGPLIAGRPNQRPQDTRGGLFFSTKSPSLMLDTMISPLSKYG